MQRDEAPSYAEAAVHLARGSLGVRGAGDTAAPLGGVNT
jgi:hypothetical protein